MTAPVQDTPEKDKHQADISSITGETGGDGGEGALNSPRNPSPYHDARGKLKKGHTLRQDRAARSQRVLDEEQWKNEFVQAVMQVWNENGKAGLRKAFKEKPRDYLQLVANITKVQERAQEVRVLKLVCARATVPDDWKPELYDDATNATEQLLSEPRNPTGAIKNADSGATESNAPPS